MWKQYEVKLHQVLKDNYPNSDIEYDDLIFGNYSRTERQIDIAIRGNLGGNKILGVIDCKYFNKKIDLKVVESFIGMLQDVNANFGLMITNKGYSKSAKSRVKNSNLKLDILNFDELGEIHLTVDYFFNKNIWGLQLSKNEFFKRNENNSFYFDSEKSNYKKRLIVFKEGYANTEYFAKKKLIEACLKAFRDFSQIRNVSLVIPSKNDLNDNFLYKCNITRHQIELFFELDIEYLREDILYWRNFLETLSKPIILEFAEKFITSERISF